MTTPESKTKIKKSKVRSPNYPLIGLEKAVEMVTGLHAEYGKHPAPIHLLHKKWGYTEGSGVGNQAVAALSAYGLVDISGTGDGRKVAVSKAGQRIADGAPDRADLLRKAALGPKIHQEVLEHYGDKGLPVDELLKQYLVWDRPEGRRFNKDTVGEFIERFRGTLAYAGVTSIDTIEEDGGGPDEDSEDPPLTRTNGLERKRPMQAGMNEDVFSLAEGAIVLQWPARLSTVSAADAQDWLELIGRKIKRAAAGSQDRFKANLDEDGNDDEPEDGE